MNIHQGDLDGDIDRLVQESLPKGINYKDSMFMNRSYVNHARPPGSLSAVARLKSSTTASPLARFNPFLSPQAGSHTSMILDESTASINDVFKCLKQSAPPKQRLPNEKSEVHSIGKKVPLRTRGVRDYQENFEDCFAERVNERTEKVLTSQTDTLDVLKETSEEEEEEVCSLYLWIIKPVPGLSAVRVEGKTSLTGNEFWQSGMVTRRINEKLVETQSGSVYKLEGNMELMDAIAGGYSRSVAEAFWLGFPTDWKQLIDEEFHRHNYSRELLDADTEDLSADEEEEICVVEAFDELDEHGGEKVIQPEMDTTDEGLTAGTVEGILDTLDRDLADSDTAAENSPVVEDADKPLKASMMIKPVKVKKTIKPKECVLTQWIIKPLPMGAGIHVMGLNQEGIVWNSSAIERRLDKKRLLSSTGSIYRLKGNMDELLTKQEGIPEELILKFKKGFPKEWQELIQEHLSTKESVVSKKSKRKLAHGVKSAKSDTCTRQKVVPHATPLENKSKARQSSASEKIIRKVRTSVQDKSKQRASLDGNKSSKMSSKVNSLKNTSLNSSTSSVDRPPNIIVTPSGSCFDLNNMTHSRSGRLIKPPLLSWAGQTVCLGEEGYYVKTRTESANRYCQEFQDNFWNAGKRIRNMYWKPKKDLDEDSSIIKEKPSKIKSSCKKLNIKTARQAKAMEASSTQKYPGSSKISNIDHLETSVESSRSEKSLDDSLPNIEKEIKVVLNDIRTSNRLKKAKSSTSTCYQTKDKGNTHKGNQKDLYTIDSDDDFQTDSQKTHKLQHTIRKQDTKVDKSKKQLDQVGIISSTTEELVQPSSRTTRSSARRNEVTNETLQSGQEAVLNMDQNNSRSRNCQRRTRRLTAISYCDHDTDDNLEYEPISLKKSTRKSKKSLDSNESVSDLDNTLTDNLTWKPSEIERLNLAFKRTNNGDPNFWENVAEIVGTKTAEACRDEFHRLEKATSTKKKKTCIDDKERSKATALTANRGTLKRKRQLCEIINHHNENCSDNFFDSTPYRKTRKRKMTALEELDGDSFLEELAKKQGKSRFETPKGEVERTYFPKYASEKKTPMSSVNFEEIDERENVDGYVHRIMKRRLHTKPQKKKILATPKQNIKKPAANNDSPHQNLFLKFIREQESDHENHEDSELEKDYYWDEEEIAN